MPASSPALDPPFLPCTIDLVLQEVRLLGVAYVDSFGDLVPARASPGGGAWRRRTGVDGLRNGWV